MRVVFMGTPETAVPPLQKILQCHYEVSGIFTQPDRPRGRGHKKIPSPVKIFAEQEGIPVFQPEKISEGENRKILGEIHPDFIVVAAYGQILPEWILQTAKLAPLNIHFSLLPLYRGAAPVAHAILNGDCCTGITIMIMQKSLDAGSILLQRELPIPLTATTGDIEAKLSEIGADLLIETMEAYTQHTVMPVEQNDNEATWAPRISKNDARIDWGKNAMQIHNLIRAMNPRPGAFTFFEGQKIHIWSSIPETDVTGIKSGQDPGTYLGLDQNSLRMQCGNGSVLKVQEIQKPSKKRINGREFISGERTGMFEKLFEI